MISKVADLDDEVMAAGFLGVSLLLLMCWSPLPARIYPHSHQNIAQNVTSEKTAPMH